jgi:hypothetical protein
LDGLEEFFEKTLKNRKEIKQFKCFQKKNGNNLKKVFIIAAVMSDNAQQSITG